MIFIVSARIVEGMLDMSLATEKRRQAAFSVKEGEQSLSF